MRNSPRFSAPALLMLAAGIALSGTCYAILEAAVLRAIPFEAAQDLVQVVKETRSAGVLQGNLSRADFELLRTRAHCFQVLGYEVDLQGSLQKKVGGIVAIQEAHISPDLLQVFRLRPKVGRLFETADFSGTAPPAVLLSFDFWNSTLEGDPGIVGKHITVDGRDSVVVGVLPESVRQPLNTAQIWLPDTSSPVEPDSAAKSDEYVIGRLGSRRSLSAVNGDLARFHPIAAAGLQNTNFAADSFRALSFADQLVGPAKRILDLLLLACLLIQTVACLNVGQLLLARRISRTRDLGIRLALGCSTAQLYFDVLCETLTIAFMAVVLAIALLPALLPAAGALAAEALGSPIHSRISPMVLVCCMSLGLFSCLLCSIIPMLVLRRGDALTLINVRWQSGPLSVIAARLQDLLLAAQVAAAVVLMLGFGLLLKSLYRLSIVTLGFEPNHLSYVLFDAGSGSFPASEFRIRAALDRLCRIPAVKAAAAGSTPILTGLRMELPIAVQSQEGRWVNVPPVIVQSVSGSYFETLGAQLLTGRTFNEHDTKAARCVAIVNQSLARLAWSTHDPVGHRVDINAGFDGKRRPCEIVGLVADTRDISLARPPEPELFFSDLQQPAAANAVILIRSKSGQSAPLEAVRRIVASADPSRRALFSTDVGALVDTALTPAETRLKLFGGLALAALLLAVGGMYAAATFGLSLRTREIGVRLAMGATLSQLATLIYRHYAKLAAVGGLLGVAVGGAIGCVFSSGVTLFEVQNYDSSVFAAVPIACIVIVLTSVCWPTLRTIRGTPSDLLRIDDQ